MPQPSSAPPVETITTTSTTAIITPPITTITDNNTRSTNSDSNSINTEKLDRESQMLSRATSSVWWRQPLRFHLDRIYFLFTCVKSLLIPSYRKKDRQRLTMHYGRDIATFFIFQQQLIFALFICSVLLCAILIPIHMTGTRPVHESSGGGTGEDDDEGLTSPRLERVSLAMRIDEAGIQAVHVCLSCLFVFIFAFFFLYRYLKNSVVSRLNHMQADDISVGKKTTVSVVRNRKSYRSIHPSVLEQEKERLMGDDKTNENGDDNGEDNGDGDGLDNDTVQQQQVQVVIPNSSENNDNRSEEKINGMVAVPSPSPVLKSPFCVCVDSVPIDMDHKTFYDICQRALSEIQLEGSVAHIFMIPNFVQRIDKEQELLDTYRKKDQVDYWLMQHRKSEKDGEKKKKKEKLPTVTLCCRRDTMDRNKFKMRTKYDATLYYDKMVNRLSNDIDIWDRRYAMLLQQNMDNGHRGSSNSSNIEQTASNNPEMPSAMTAILPAQDASSSVVNNDTGTGTRTSLYTDSVIYCPNGDIFATPRCSGVGFIVFTSKQARKRFCKAYARSGINIASKKDKTREPSQSQPKIWQKKKKQLVLEESGNSVKKSNTIQYSLQAKSVLTKVDLLGMSSMRVSTVDYEPEDIDWHSVFQKNQLGKGGNLVKQLIIYAILLFVLIFVSTPAALASGLQEILAMDVIEVGVEWVKLITGTFGGFFQYLPSLILMIASTIIPMVIIALTAAENRTTHSETMRTTQVRIYIYLILSVVILPSCSLVAVNGVFQYFGDTEDVLTMFSNMFLPSSGAFFVSYVLHQALLKNTLDLFLIGNLVMYGIKNCFTGRFWSRTPFARHISPISRYDPVESAALNIGLEYSYMHLIVTIALTFAIFQPIVMVCALFYFLYKYCVDRYRVMYMYSNKRDHAFYGTANQFRLDYRAHIKLCALNLKLIFGSLFVFTFLQTVFYILKDIGKKSDFVGHTVVLGLLSILCLLCIPLVHYLVKRMARREIRENNAGCNKGPAVEVNRESLAMAYEPIVTYPFLPFLCKLHTK